MGQGVEQEEDYRIREEDDMPFACLICRGDFVNPVVTLCGHYFCEQCALQRYAKDTKCAACGMATNGIFNTAHKLIQVLKRRKELEEKLSAGKKEEEEDDVAAAAAQSGDTQHKFQAQQGWVIP